MPINDLPRLPDGVITGLGSVLEESCPTWPPPRAPAPWCSCGNASGPTILPADRVWAEVLATMCRARRIVVRGTYHDPGRRHAPAVLTAGSPRAN